MKRRDALSAAGTVLLGATVPGRSAGATDDDVSESSITFTHQRTNGTAVTVERVATDVAARFVVRDSDSNVIGGPTELEAGTVLEDYEVELLPPLSETERISANLYDADGQGIARETAEIRVENPPELVSGMEPTFVEPDPDSGFNYPYYLYAPPRVDDQQSVSILVQPTNSGQATDDFGVQRQSADDRIRNGTSRTIADRLAVPLLVPVFPRPSSDPVDWRHYVHALDRQTMQIEDGPLERVDLQLLRMVEDAGDRLEKRSYPVDDQVLLNGFSAAGNFVDRFTLLHPDRVRSVTAGGLNGTAMLPIEEAAGHRLPFHIGIADVEALTGDAVDLDALDATNQFLYMGEDDGNDTIPYDDAWGQEMREIALDVYGEDMVADRFPTCQRAYEEAAVDAQFKVYEGVSHTPRPAIDDIVEFHQRSLDGEDVTDFGQELGLRPTFEYTPERPAPGEAIEFDASPSTLGVGEILAYTWQFANEETAAGESVRHRFTDPGEYSVTLRAIDSKGRAATTTTSITVGGHSNAGASESTAETTTQSSPASKSETTGTPADPTSVATETTADSEVVNSTTGETEGSAPGFGIAAAVTSIGGAAYALTNWGGN
jgi:hypothetical protein